MIEQRTPLEDAKAAALKLSDYCRANDWAGHDPYDALNSRIVVPRGAPNLVCSSFVANALLDAYEQRQESRYLTMSLSAAEYIKNELYWTEGSSVAGFSYPLASLRAQIHNANFLAAAL